MRILQLVTRRQYRGAEVFAAQLSTELLKQGHEVIFAGLYAPPLKPLEVTGAENIDLSQLAPRLLPHWSIIEKVDQIVRDRNIDLVQANASDNLKYAIISRRVNNWLVPVVFRNASILSAWLRTPIHRLFNLWLLRQTDAIACVSQKSKQDLIQLGVSASKLYHLPIGTKIPKSLNIDRAKAYLRSQTSIPEGALVLMHIGAFSQEKNQIALIKLLSHLPTIVEGKPIHLVFIGDGPLRAVIEECAVDLSDRVHFMGYRQDVPELLPAADLFLLPSLIEGTPGVVLEAAAHKVPVVAYDVGSVEECMPPELSANLVKAQMLDRFVKVVEDLLHEKDKRKMQGEAGFSFVKSRYRLEYICARFTSLYEKLTGNVLNIEKGG